MSREIDELAEAGRTEREARERAARKKEEAEDGLIGRTLDRAMERLVILASMTGWAHLAVVVLWMLTWIAVFTLALMVGLMGSATVWAWAGFTTLVFVAPPTAWVLVWRRRLAWRDHLPFALVDYPEVHTWRRYPSMTMAVHFERPPDPAVVRDVLGGATLPTTVQTRDDGALVLEVHNPDASKHDFSRRWLDRWLRDTIDRLLLPFHREHRIQRITLGD